ncbi:UbiA family prenyltransferase [Haloarchaeobius litoreus]|uniref:UbiA family prenyltransferase n=1 Tax=Haloarchaeobius litoreus TaxID=755306 RepID=A0ABD6DHC1_9EURY|nr:UbiA family prenyltransferase [Haloarchaeobius litoreus]
MSQSNDPHRPGQFTYRLPDPTAAAERAFGVAKHASVIDGLVAATKVVVVSVLLSLPLSVAVLLAGLVTFSVYGSNKLVDDEDEVNCPDRASFVARNREALLAGTLGAYVLALGLAALEGLDSFLLTLVPAAAAVLYSTPWLPFDGGTRVKDVLVLNTVLVAGAWAAYVSFIPVAYVDAPVTPTAVVVCVFFFLQTVVAGEVLNARDVAGDRAEGVSTMATVLGVRRTQFVLYALDGVTLALLGWAATTGLLAVPLALALIPAVGYSLLVTALVGRSVDLDWLGTCRDCQYAVMLCCVLVAV